MPYGGMGGYQQAGGIGSFLTGIGKAAVGFLTGGPVGAVQAVLPHAPAPPSTPIPSFGGGNVIPTPGVAGIVQRTLPGGASGYSALPRGYHVSKSGKVVKNRRRNFANGKALNRAIGRVSGFERMVKRNRKALRKLSRI